MNLLNPPNLLSRSLMGAVGLSAIALLGAPDAVKAASIWRGSDYLQTPGGGTTVYNFGPEIGEVSFKGLPIGPGLTDTIVERQGDCLLPNVGDSCQIPIEMVALSLVSEAPIQADFGFGLLNYDIFVGLTPGQGSTGTMTIRHENDDTAPSQGTFDSFFDVFFRATLVEVGGDGTKDPDPVDRNVQMTVNGAPWSHTPPPGDVIVLGDPGDAVGDNNADQAANCHDSNDPLCPIKEDLEGNLVGDFFLVGLVQHDASGAAKHGVEGADVPEPLTILGSAAALGFGAVFKRKGSKNGQSQKA